MLQACTILAACRDDKNKEEMKRQIAYLSGKYEAKIELLDAPLMDISSSDIRQMVGYGMSVESIVPPAVLEYMEARQLYKKVNEE